MLGEAKKPILSITSLGAGGNPPSPVTALLGRRHYFAFCRMPGPKGELVWTRHLDSKGLVDLIETAALVGFEVHICPQTIPKGATPRRDMIRNARFLVVDLDDCPLEPDEVLAELKERGAPRPTALIWTSERGYHIYWKLWQPLYLEPARSWGTRLFEATARAVVKALQDLGADPQAATLGHLFKIWPAALVHCDPNATTSLGELWRWAKPRARPRPRRKPRYLPSRIPVGLKHIPLWHWLWGNVFPEGKRNQALVALLILAFRKGMAPDDARALMRRWVAECTSPTYPLEEAERVFASLRDRFAEGKPLGLKAERLRDLGVPPGVIAVTYKLLRYTLKRPSERLKKPRLVRFIELLEFIGRNGITRASARALSGRAGIPYTTLTTTLAPALAALGGNKLARPPQRKRFLDLTMLRAACRLGAPRASPIKQNFETRAVLLRTLEALFGCSGADLRRAIAFWGRREPELLVRLLEAVRRLRSLILGVAGLGVPTSGPRTPSPEEALRTVLDGISSPDGPLIALGVSPRG